MLPGHVLTQNTVVRVEELAGATDSNPRPSCVTGRILQFQPQRFPIITTRLFFEIRECRAGCL